MKELKEELQKIAYSPETYQKIVDIGKIFNLNIDQEGELAAETMDIITAVTSSDDFVANFAERAEIDQQTAYKIGQEVNKQIFDAIRDKLKLVYNNEHHDGEETVSLMTDSSVPKSTVTDRDEMIAAIENPTPLKSRPINVLEAISTNNDIADHMLKGAVSKPIETVKVSAPKPPVAPSPIRKTDPYREPIE
ncbi:MAG: hypothetical protein RIT04_215 [Candidatus Parcubacteria bacterium]|jgi:predicted transcriptional regulator